MGGACCGSQNTVHVISGARISQYDPGFDMQNDLKGEGLTASSLFKT